MGWASALIVTTSPAFIVMVPIPQFFMWYLNTTHIRGLQVGHHAALLKSKVTTFAPRTALLRKLSVPHCNVGQHYAAAGVFQQANIGWMI
jgi:hypothetical protein